MGGSQLKQLKTQLRENGILGPQKSKKQRQQNPRKDAASRAKRNAVLTDIRERMNPFETRAPSRPSKYDVASNKPSTTKIERPGVTRGLGEERRRETLLKEVQGRHKVGAMVDRRFGEGEVNVNPEVMAAERFARAAGRRMERENAFNLEEDSGDELVLTHGGRRLFEDGEQPARDDFEESVSGSEEDEGERPRKRIRMAEEEQDEEGADLEDEDNTPSRKKTKKEVMEEVIAKSKMHKALRQQAKEDDDDLRLELDKGMADFYDALNLGQKPSRSAQLPTPPTEPVVDPARAAMIAGKSREDAEKEYEANLRQMKMDARSKPTFRTKSEDEEAAEEKARLEDLERKRLRRMHGEADSSDEEDDDFGDQDDDADVDPDDAEAFGLAQPAEPYAPNLAVEDEDEFVMDDIIASDSDADAASESESDDSDAEPDDDGDDDFINGLVLPPQPSTAPKESPASKNPSDLAYTFPCPTTHAELLDLTANNPSSSLPTIVQRIRALYHKSLSPSNPAKLATFATVLTQHISHLATHSPSTPISTIEQLIRHLHSMAKSQPDDVAFSFREQLRVISSSRPLKLNAGDLIILTAISTIFPTSDQWHPVVTPAMLTITRYLAHSQIETVHDLATGAYCCTLALKYQAKSQRYIPELVTYIYKAIELLSPTPPDQSQTHLRPPSARPQIDSLRVKLTQQPTPAVTQIPFNALRNLNPDNSTTLTPRTLLQTFLHLTHNLSTLYAPLPSSPELLAPLLTLITSLHPSLHANLDLREHLTTTIATQTSLRKPLLLHTHRPLAIKSSIPAFTENYNPDRHYDPDRDRAELSKLKAEHKKERKGAMRELRKDASFLAREGLREKKAKDEAYEKKYRRLVAEIQGEEGREAKDYEREQKKRRGKW